jgi:hypothetical protein
MKLMEKLTFWLTFWCFLVHLVFFDYWANEGFCGLSIVTSLCCLVGSNPNKIYFVSFHFFKNCFQKIDKYRNHNGEFLWIKFNSFIPFFLSNWKQFYFNDFSCSNMAVSFFIVKNYWKRKYWKEILLTHLSNLILMKC